MAFKPFNPDTHHIRKAIQATKLIELLTKLPSGSWVMPNAVQNLVVLDEKGAMMLGFIDIAEEDYTTWGE